MRYTLAHIPAIVIRMPDGPDKSSTAILTDAALLGADEPSPFYILNPLSEVPVLLICDHASCRFPSRLGDLGLDPFARRCHLAVDIGAGSLTEKLAKSLKFSAVLAQYSRLVVDCNRELMDPGAFLEYGDGILVPGNRNLSQTQKDMRAGSIYWPYHDAIDGLIKRLEAVGPSPAFISIHSFSPVMNGVARPWQMGVLWDKDESLAEIFIEDLRAAGYHTGDNEPYSGKAPQDFTIDHHAEDAGLPHVGIEVRQDLLSDPAGIARVAAVMHKIIESIPERIQIGRSRISA